MANKAIGDLTAATQVTGQDLFVLEQSGTAKKLTGSILESWLLTLADGHGGIASIAKTGTSGLTDTYTITYADETTTTFTVKNGRGITSITWTTSGTSGDGRYHYGTITYNDGTTTSVTIRDGLKGDTGQAWYVHIKYSDDQPTSDAQMGDIPSDWIGIYSGTSDTAPAHYTDYDWFKIKGDTGNTGASAALVNPTVEYLESSNGVVVPEGSWSTTVPAVTAGNFLWTRTRLPWNDGQTVTAYSVARFGIDGAGAVSSVNNVSPDSNGNVALEAASIPTADSTSVQVHLTQIESDITTLGTYEVHHVTTSLTTLPTTISAAWITAEHRVINCVFGTPASIGSDVTWTTTDGTLSLSGTLSASTTIDLDIARVI